MHRVCAQVKYRQMFSTCIGSVYADAQYMRIPTLCRCLAYGYVQPMLTSLFFREDPKKCSSGSSSPAPARSGRRCPYPVFTVAFRRDDTPYVVFYPVPDDRVLHTGKRRFAYLPAVVHFRKVLIRQKIGSAGNWHPVIYRRGYMAAYYQPENDGGRGKSFM